MTSANLLVILLVGTAVGAIAGWVLGPFFQHSLYLEIVAGFFATIIAETRAQHDLASHGRRPGHFKYPNSRYFIFRDCVPCWQRGSGRGRPREPTQLTSLDRHSRWPVLKHSDGVANDRLLHEP